MSLLTHLSISECKHGYLYFIHANHFHLAVFDQERCGFVGIREKLGEEYVFCQFHYDYNGLFGTAAPYLELEKCPIDDLSTSSAENVQVRIFTHFKDMMDKAKAQREGEEYIPPLQNPIVNPLLHNYLIAAEGYYTNISERFFDFRLLFEFLHGWRPKQSHI